MLSSLARCALSLDGEGVVCWAKRSLTQLMQGLVLCPWISPDGAGVWSQQGQQDGKSPAVAAFRVYAPPAQVAASRVLWGHLRGFSL